VEFFESKFPGKYMFSELEELLVHEEDKTRVVMMKM